MWWPCSWIMQGEYDAMPWLWKCIDLQSDESCWLSVRLASSVIPKVLMLSEKGIWEPAIVGVETKGNLRRRCRVPNKVDSRLLLLSARPLWQNQWCKADKQEERRVKCAIALAVVEAISIWVSSAYCWMLMSNDETVELIGEM